MVAPPERAADGLADQVAPASPTIPPSPSSFDSAALSNVDMPADNVPNMATPADTVPNIDTPANTVPNVVVTPPVTLPTVTVPSVTVPTLAVPIVTDQAGVVTVR
jgi:hypothetical protein